ncbi:hypothetical protein CIRG_07516 [Coccidioides immitis RMSCC 2394]|uniref:Impact N-terminal domain-containing protein n=1 Tax=Coccidioides immitis RMSCC 2394 TaxID=404692 RepID=A0A0J6YJK3_COCIT|nr:hypothetical protein CIRG_07516 [Coccidioides immitis RMSCC 2394]
MATTAEVQAILRFLSQESKVPLALAIAKVKDLRDSNLLKYQTPSPEHLSSRLFVIEALAKADIKQLQTIFNNAKIAKQVSNGAKRAVKKRSADGDLTRSTPKRSRRTQGPEGLATPAQLESSLAISISTDADAISETIVVTNRAPLVLAFAFVLLKYTMPEQPISSRLSLAQAVVSANSRSKAAKLGIEKGPSAEEEGWAKGQPSVKVLGREISVLKRLGYFGDPEGEDGGSQASSITLPEEAKVSENSPSLWGLDLEALRKSNGPVLPGASRGQSSILPIYRPESARDYLLKSFSFDEQDSSVAQSKKRGNPAEMGSNQEKCLGLLLGAVDLLCTSWSSTLSKYELDRRAWAWYLKVRPDVQAGPAGWGQKGRVHLSDILALRK